MPKISITFGALLIALTVVSLVLAGGITSPTMFIPTGFGVGLILCGLIGMNPAARKHAMHIAAMIGLIGAVAGLGRGIPGLLKVVRSNTSALSEVSENAPNPLALSMVWGMAILCSIFLFLCIRSFIQARRNRQAAEK